MYMDNNKLMLYGITDRSWLEYDCNGSNREHIMTLKEQVSIALDSGVTMLQLREKDVSKEGFLNEAIELNSICRERNIPLIINDDIDIAIKVGASGVHLGQKDMSALDARKILPHDMILGVSAATVDEAIKAEESGADYIGVGDVFGTSTKKNARHITTEVLSDICKSVDIPAVAIGGITYDNLTELSGTGISGIAVISAIFSKPDISKAVKELKSKVLEILY